jgi:hypothetical protein
MNVPSFPAREGALVLEMLDGFGLGTLVLGWEVDFGDVGWFSEGVSHIRQNQFWPDLNLNRTYRFS